MARSYYTCPECGVNEIRVDGHNRRRADSLAAWHLAQGHICQDCRDKKRQQANMAASEANAAAGLPTLTGSGAQILWAESIRAQKISYLDQILSGQEAPDGSAAVKDAANIPLQIQRAADAMRAQTSASWWIDIRDDRVITTLGNLAREQAAQPPVAPIAEETACAEATIRPANPRTETVAEIRPGQKAVSIHFPEKREDFRELVRFQLGYTWNKDRWRRELSFAGTPEDRAAEAGHKLLAAGFIIRIFDESVRAAAISGNYKPEQTRWVRVLVSGDYKGWFALSWKRPDDFYSEAKRLPGSRYVSPVVAVPPEQYEQVQDFAELHSFEFSAAALEILEKARAAHDAALVVDVAPVKTAKGHKAQTKPPKLEIPNDIDVDPTLEDK